MRKMILFAAVLYLSMVNLLAQPRYFGHAHQDGTISKTTRKQSIKAASTRIQLLQPMKETEVAKFEDRSWEEMPMFSVRIVKSGVIRFANGEWIYIETHSSHQNPLAGDFSIAITNTRKKYLNEGHICGDIIHFESTGQSAPSNAKQFFDNFKSDIDGFSWRKVKNR